MRRPAGLLALIVAALSSGVQAAEPPATGWTFRVEANPMTDARRGIALLLGDAGGLAVKCDSNGPGSLYFSVLSTHYLGGAGWQKNRAIRYRIDKGAVVSLAANHDGSAASVFETSPNSDGGRFLTNLMNSSNELVVQITDFDSNIYNIVFTTTGAKDAILKSAVACGDTEWADQ